MTTTNPVDFKAALAPLFDMNVAFPQRPKIIADLHFFDMPDGLGVQVHGLEKTIILRGKLSNQVNAWLFSALDGSGTAEEIVRSRPANCSVEEAVAALLLFYRKGLVYDAAKPKPGNTTESHQAPDETARRQLLFWGRQVGITRANNDGNDVAQKLKKAKILLLGNGLFAVASYDLLSRSGYENIQALDWSSDCFLAHSLKELNPDPGIVEAMHEMPAQLEKRLNAILPHVDLLITALRNCSDDVFACVNRLCIRHQTKWLRGHDNASSMEVGPYVDPYSSGCFACLHIRQVSATDFAVEDTLYQRYISVNPITEQLSGESLCTATLAASFLCSEAIRITTMVQQPLFENSVLTVTNGGAVNLNKFRPVPRCPDCYRGNHARLAQQEATANIRS